MVWFDEDFYSINRADFYRIIQLRQQVFVLEQFCPYVDCDDKDLFARHLFAKSDKDIAAYCRLLKVGLSYVDAASIGRIVTNPNYRGKRFGHQLMIEAIKKLKIHYGEVPVRIGAQCYLEKFYTRYGFKTSSNVYLEDGIPHYEMDLDWKTANNLIA